MLDCDPEPTSGRNAPMVSCDSMLAFFARSTTWSRGGFFGRGKFRRPHRRVSLTRRRSYDRQRYERLQQLAAIIMSEGAGIDTQVVEGLFAEQRGYATPKIDVRGAVFKNGLPNT
ncbi:MAG: NUDIX hydrolase N-terminal domain-containing protein [Bradyrhizobium sp.]|nr:NUDIX hydrolase N-terminal domain-containing protein [Bradyrhizobium sp.]